MQNLLQARSASDVGFSVNSSLKFEGGVSIDRATIFDKIYMNAVNRSVKKINELKVDLSSGADSHHELESDAIMTSDDDCKVIDIPKMFNTTVVNGLSINTLQEWRGIVTECYDGYFSADLYDLMHSEGDRQIAEIPLIDVAPSDRGKIAPGVIFHLLVGFVRRPGGNQGRETMIYLRRHKPTASSKTAELADLLDELV